MSTSGPISNPYNIGDLGRMGESHQADGLHHTLYRPGTHISWDTDAAGNFLGGHTEHADGTAVPWSSPVVRGAVNFDPN
jgi:hypothetical protein